MKPLIAIFGAGAWGTALALHLVRQDRARVVLWARDPAQAAAMAAARVNARYLPGMALPGALVVTANLADARDAQLLIAAPPVAALPELVATVARASLRAPLFWLSKGFLRAPALPGGAGLPHRVVGPLWPAPVGVISGPSFAEEVARGLPTALAVAATDPGAAAAAACALRGGALRTYESDDIAGVEVGGAVKNVLAIAAGASDGLGFGNNARAALITRGLAETGRLLLAEGGQRETLMGLAGLGDLVLTCTGDLSRNRTVGIELGRGKKLDDILRDMKQVAEGVKTAKSVRELAKKFDVELPICDQVYAIAYEGKSARAAAMDLMVRSPKSELM